MMLWHRNKKNEAARAYAEHRLSSALTPAQKRRARKKMNRAGKR